MENGSETTWKYLYSTLAKGLEKLPADKQPKNFPELQYLFKKYGYISTINGTTLFI